MEELRVIETDHNKQTFLYFCCCPICILEPRARLDVLYLPLNNQKAEKSQQGMMHMQDKDCTDKKNIKNSQNQGSNVSFCLTHETDCV